MNIKSLPNNPEELKKIIEEMNTQLNQNSILLSKKDSEISDLKFRVNILNKAVFGKKSEKWTQEEKEQSLLFNEIESNLNEDYFSSNDKEISLPTQIPNEPLLITEVKSYTRKTPGRVSIPESFPREEIIHDISEAEKNCSCGCKMQSFGEEIVEKVNIIPSQIKVTKHIRLKYICKNCKGTHPDISKEVKIAPPVPQFLPKAIADTGFLAYIFVAKFCDGIPFYRLCNILKRHEFTISRGTLCNNARDSFDRLKFLDDDFWNLILQSPVLQIDETPLKVLNESSIEKINKESKSYMFVIRAEIRGKPIIKYIYNPTRSSKFLQEKLKNYNGILHTDGFKSYDSLTSVMNFSHHAGCWVHARREFIRILDTDKAHRGAGQFVSLIAEIYKIEARISKLDFQSIQNIRNIESRLIVNKILTYLDDQLTKTMPNSPYGKALAYLKNQWPKLIIFLDCPELKADTNLVENAIRPFVIGRKNWLFSATTHGAEASAFFYSLIETAKANSLEPTEYLRNLMDQVTIGNKPNLL